MLTLKDGKDIPSSKLGNSGGSWPYWINIGTLFCGTFFGLPGHSTAAPGPVPHSEPQGWQHPLDLGCYAPITPEASGAVSMTPHHGWVDSHHMPSLIHTNLIFMEFGKILMCYQHHDQCGYDNIL
jgi:hypothetical protein